MEHVEAFGCPGGVSACVATVGCSADSGTPCYSCCCRTIIHVDVMLALYSVCLNFYGSLLIHFYRGACESLSRGLLAERRKLQFGRD